MADIGYAPIAHGAGSYLPDMTDQPARAHEVDGQGAGALYGADSARPVHVHQVTLGAEHAHLAKSIVERHVRLQKSGCRLCMSGGGGHAGPQVCTCSPISALDVAKAIVPRLSNRLRASLSVEDVARFVSASAKIGFKVPTFVKSDGHGFKHGDQVHYSPSVGFKDPQPARVGGRSTATHVHLKMGKRSFMAEAHEVRPATAKQV